MKGFVVLAYSFHLVYATRPFDGLAQSPTRDAQKTGSPPPEGSTPIVHIAFWPDFPGEP